MTKLHIVCFQETTVYVYNTNPNIKVENIIKMIINEIYQMGQKDKPVEDEVEYMCKRLLDFNLESILDDQTDVYGV